MAAGLIDERSESEFAADYARLRGRCREMATEAASLDPSLRLVRGFYHDPLWGREEHWWCLKADGGVYDPTAGQFPSNGKGVYELLNDHNSPRCDMCGERMNPDQCQTYGRFCSYDCFGVAAGI